MLADERCRKDRSGQSSKTCRRKERSFLFFGPTIDVMVVLACAILRHGRHDLGRNFAHIFDDHIGNMPAWAVGGLLLPTDASTPAVY